MALKKEWYKIKAPASFGGKIIGETLASDPKQVIGRVVKIPSPDVSKKYSQFYIKLHFKITSVNKTCNTKFIGHSIQKDRIYKMVRRRKRRVDAIQKVKTKDNTPMKIKTVLVLRRRVKTSIKDRTRRKIKEIIQKEASKSNTTEFVNKVIFNLGRTIKRECSKIYPVSGIQIRKSTVLSSS